MCDVSRHYCCSGDGFEPSPMISKETYDIVMAHAEELDSAIIYDKDFNYNYFGFKTMEVVPVTYDADNSVRIS